MPDLGKAWNATKWTATNLTPLGSRGRTVWAIGGVVALGGVALATPDAFAVAAKGLATGTGTIDYLRATGTLVGNGLGVGADIAVDVGNTLPGAYNTALKAAAPQQ